MPWPTCARSTRGCSTWPPPRAVTSPPGWPRSVCACSPGRAVLTSPTTVRVETADGVHELEADVVLVATGATPRVMDTARPDGERILTWQQIYDLDTLPERLVVVGSGVTGAELAQAYLGLGSEVVLVSSRDRVLPGEDPDAAQVIEDVFTKRGMEVLGRSRMASVERTADGVARAPRGRPRGRRVARPAGRRARCRTPRASGSRTSGSSSRHPGTSPSTGSRAPRCAGCTPPATAPGCCRSRPWRPCRAASRCRTPSGMPSRR